MCPRPSCLGTSPRLHLPSSEVASPRHFMPPYNILYTADYTCTIDSVNILLQPGIHIDAEAYEARSVVRMTKKRPLEFMTIEW